MLLAKSSVIVCLVWGPACTSPSNQTDNDVRLRVGATWGLTSFLESEEAGSSASAVRLAYDPIVHHIASASRDGLSVSMIVRQDSSASAEVLARSFKSQGLVSAKAIGKGRIVAVFSDMSDATRAVSLRYGGFDLGPFELKQLNDDGVTLSRRREHSISEIQIQDVSASDEWRLFLGGQLDVVPISSFVHRGKLTRHPGIKIVDYPRQHAMGLLFNTQGAALKDVRARHHVSSLIDRRALIQILGGGTPMGYEAQLNATTDNELLPKSLTLTYLESDLGTSRTADVVRFQLSEHNIDVNLAPRDIAGLIAMEGIADMTLLPVPQTYRGYDRFLSKAHPEAGNITGYSNPEFDAAYDAHDTETMDALLKRDVPVTLLYEQEYFAAMRSDLCIDEEPDPTSWRWLASIYPCDEGPAQ